LTYTYTYTYTYITFTNKQISLLIIVMDNPESLVGADYDVSQNKPDIRKGYSLVMLSRSEASRCPTR